MTTEIPPTGSAEEQAARSADLDAEQVDQQGQLARGEEVRPRRDPEAGTTVADRVDFLSRSPLSKGCPAAEIPAFAAALREWVDSLAPGATRCAQCDHMAHEDLVDLCRGIGFKAFPREAAKDMTWSEGIDAVETIVRQRDAAEARVRELEGAAEGVVALAELALYRQVAGWLDVTLADDEDPAAAIESNIEGLLDEVADHESAEQAAARHGYQQGEAEALGWTVAALGNGEVPMDMDAEALRSEIEHRIMALQAAVCLHPDPEEQAATDEHADELAPTCGAQHPTGPAVCGETSPHPRGRHRGAPPHKGIEWSDAPPRRAQAKAVRAAVRGEGPPVDLGGTEGPAQVELITVRDDAPPPAPAAKKKPARKPAAPPPASPWTLGAQVLAPVKSGSRRAVVVNLGREDTISVVLRKEGKLKAEVPTRAYRPEEFTEDPRADQGGIREALACLKASPIPPVEWIAALEDL